MKISKNLNFRATVLLMAAVVAVGCSGNNFSGNSATPAVASTTGSTTTSNVAVTASNPANPDAGGSVNLPQGVALITESGQTVSGDSVQVTIEAFDGSAASEGEVKGGVTFVDQSVNSQIANALGVSVDSSKAATLDLAGFANVNVSAGGQSIKQFSPPIGISIKTNLPVNVIVAVISIDEKSGARRFEGTAQVGQGGNVQIDTDHLTTIAVVRNIKGQASGAGGSTQ